MRLAVLVQRPLVPQRVQAGCGHHHGLGLPADLAGDVVAEVVHDHFGPSGQVVVVQRHESGDRCAGPGLVQVGIIADGLVDLEVRLIGDVVGQHVVDEALFDGLAHRIGVERRLVTGPFDRAAEQLDGAALRCSGEREERHVRLAASGGHLFGQEVLHRVG